MSDLRKHSSTSNIIRVVLKHSTTGQGLTGLTEASAGLIIGTVTDNEAATTRYRASSSEVETIATLGTFAAPTSGKCRFKEVDATNHPGLYEIQIADARFSVASAKRLIVSLAGAANLLGIDYEIQLTLVDAYDAAAFGMTRLDAAISSRMATFTLPTNFSSLVIDSSGRVDISKWLGAAVDALSSGKVPADLKLWLAVAPLALASQLVRVQTDTNGDKTGYALTSAYDPAKTAAQAGDAMTLSAAYDAAKTAATQSSVDDLPTNAELAIALAAADDAVLAAIAALNNLSQANVRSALGVASANLDAQLDALPTNAELATALGTADDAVLAAIAALNIPSLSAIAAQIIADHGSGSYVRNTEPDNTGIGVAAAAAVSAATDAASLESRVPVSPAAVGSAMTLTSGERDAIAAALLDLADAIEVGLTFRKALRGVASATFGKGSGLGTSTATYRNAVADSKARIIATVDADGNRSAVTTDLT